jgi:GNAT superfamily N-acetyltransferase
VGVAGVRRILGGPASAAVLNWVGVDPDHRGLGLSKILTSMAIRSAQAAECSLICLATDDFRLPAIRTYWRLGFRPCLNSWDRSHHWRWSRIGREMRNRLEFCRLKEHARAISALGQ